MMRRAASREEVAQMQMQTVVKAPSAFTQNWGSENPYGTSTRPTPGRKIAPMGCTSAGGGGGGFSPVTGLTFECPPTFALFEEMQAERPPCSDTTSMQAAFGNGNGRNSKLIPPPFFN